MRFLAFLGLLTSCTLSVIASGTGSRIVKHDNPFIYYHGRWDSGPGTWWAGSGFKLHVANLKSLTLNLGPATTAPFAAVGVSIGDSQYVTLNASAGANPISIPATKTGGSIVKINVEGWQNNRIQLESVSINRDAILLPYKPEKRVFQFIGDSLSAGQFLPLGVNQAWPFLVAQTLDAEQRINAQPGATLTDMESYGNAHGVSYQFFKTEDTGFFWASDHNYTTPWNFAKDQPPPTHVVIHIGANDASHSVSNDDFTKVYLEFLQKLRKLYPRQPFFIFTPWGWPHEDRTDYYYDGVYQNIVNTRKTQGDRNVFLVDTTGWVSFEDVFVDNTHPNVPGHANIAAKFVMWLRQNEHL